MAPKAKTGPIPITSKATLVYFRKVKSVDPAHRIGSTKAPTYLKFTDNIMWPYKRVPNKESTPLPINTEPDELAKLIRENQVDWLPRGIRYIHGMQTFFVDEQEKNGQPLSTQVLENYANRDALLMVDDEIRVPAYDTLRTRFLHCMNQCENQFFMARRYGNAPALYRLLDFAAKDANKILLSSLREKAFKLAIDARHAEMIPHAKYLNIDFTIPETGEDREMESIKSDYKDYAFDKPEHFIATFSDPKVKITYWIQDLMERSVIIVNNGEAIWNETGSPIGVVPPDKTAIDYLVELSMTQEGELFAKQLQAFKVVQLEDAED